MGSEEEPIPSDKPGLRGWARARRESLDMPALSGVLCERLRAEPLWRGSENVLLYLAMPGEVNVDALFAETDGGRRRFYAPRCAKNRRLAVHRYLDGATPLRAGPFGIREPDPDRVPEADPAVLDLVIVPGLVLSRDGGRIGYGGGYYDRFLPRLRPECVRAALFPSALVLPTLPADPWDAPLDLIVTEAETFFGPRLAGPPAPAIP